MPEKTVSPVTKFLPNESDGKPLTPYYSLVNYAQFFAGGGLCATLTHGALTPIDVVKTRLQLEPAGSKMSMASMARSIVKADGPSGLLAGFGPTAVGYLIQGGTKFCGYEFFKKYAIDWLGSAEKAREHRQAVYIGSATAAEIGASTLLTPLEAARIRLVSQHNYAKGLVGAVTRMWNQEGISGFYAGYVPILFKQVPFTIGQFYTNDMAHGWVNRHVSEEQLKAWGKPGLAGIQLGCGTLAGVVAAILSHPADTLLSKINKGDGGTGSSMHRLLVLARETGPIRIWAGLGTRIVMTAFLVSLQFLIYDQTKLAVGAPRSIEIS
ncbi:hypothetical protein MSPP1_000737 [Malassezia sp. CBS 17886]|nr:hypothetical protein MSPP1_000737 [Malassezia sp. CBS 17886]